MEQALQRPSSTHSLSATRFFQVILVGDKHTERAMLLGKRRDEPTVLLVPLFFFLDTATQSYFRASG